MNFVLWCSQELSFWCQWYPPYKASYVNKYLDEYIGQMTTLEWYKLPMCLTLTMVGKVGKRLNGMLYIKLIGNNKNQPIYYYFVY